MLYFGKCLFECYIYLNPQWRGWYNGRGLYIFYFFPPEDWLLSTLWCIPILTLSLGNSPVWSNLSVLLAIKLLLCSRVAAEVGVNVFLWLCVQIESVQSSYFHWSERVSTDIHLLSVIFSASRALFYSAHGEYCSWNHNKINTRQSSIHPVHRKKRKAQETVYKKHFE